MKIAAPKHCSIEFLENGLVRVTDHVNGRTYDCTECGFRYDGPAPVLDLSIFFGSIVPATEERSNSRTMDLPPDDD